VLIGRLNVKVVDRSLRFARGLLLSFGPGAVKRFLWESEYKTTKWEFADHTAGDPVYACLERFAKNGSILDVGCGSGNTSNEIAASAYRTYLGVDISSEALAKAARRSEANGRTSKNRYQQFEFNRFHTSERFDVILFRESMYHVPIRKIPVLLDKYSQYLMDDGVFVVRLCTEDHGTPKRRPTKMIETIANHFDVLERSKTGDHGVVVIVFKPRRAAGRRGTTVDRT
jgi:2-polyprenyl-3-methyl-5-hydroxy-6-metoxy-1,4-benzoquinol methylase